MSDQPLPGGQAPGVILESLSGGLLDFLPVAIAVFDLEGRLLGYNTPWLRLTREQFSDVAAEKLRPGVLITDVLPPNELRVRREEAADGRVMLEENGVRLEHDGRVSYYDVVFAPFERDGEIVGTVQVLADATERVKAKQQLERRVARRTQQVERGRQVAEGLHAILSALNSCCPQEQVLDLVVEQAKRLLGCDDVAVYRFEIDDGAVRIATAHGIEGDALESVRLPMDDGIFAETLLRRQPMLAPEIDRLFGHAFRTMPAADQKMLRRGFEHYRSLLAVPLVIAGDVYGCVALYFEQLRRFSDEDVNLASDLADHLSLALENTALRRESEESAAVAERNRLARDLHDAVTQTLFSASLIAEVLPRIWERDEGEGRRRLEELRRLARGALAEMRALLVELRPTALVEASIGDLLRQLTESAGTTGIAVSLLVEGEQPLPPDVQVAVYRIAQEALNNVAKHSGATSAEVLLACGNDGSLRMRVSDDGRGLPAEAAGADHLGMRIMRERAEAVGGKLSVTSREGRGTSVELAWPAGEEECGCPTNLSA